MKPATPKTELSPSTHPRKVVFGGSLSEFPSLERALSKNGSWWAYLCSALLLGSYVASALSLVLAPLLRWRQRSRAPRP